MTPADFREFVFTIADKVGFARERIILGGDHLGGAVGFWLKPINLTIRNRNRQRRGEKASANFLPLAVGLYGILFQSIPSGPSLTKGP